MHASPETPLRTVSSTRLVDEVLAQLRSYIGDNGLENGARLPSERTLAERLGTSRATVAQALRILAVMGLVEIRHGSGVYVRRDPGSMLGTTFDLMIDLEPGSVGQLADFRYWIEQSLLRDGGIPEFDQEEMKTGFDDLARSRGRLEPWIEADARFHVALVAATENRYLRATYETAHRKILSISYSDWLERGSVPAWLRGSRWQHQIDLHQAILDASLAGRPQDLAAALQAHQIELISHLAKAVDLPS